MSRICRRERVESQIRQAKKKGETPGGSYKGRKIVTTVLDSERDIKKCLHCEKPSCEDCIPYLPEAAVKKYKIPFPYDHFHDRFLEEYIYADSQYELMLALQTAKPRVQKYRKLFNLPLPSKVTRKQRAELVAEIRGEFIVDSL